MINRLCCALLIASVLTACGGGEGVDLALLAPKAAVVAEALPAQAPAAADAAAEAGFREVYGDEAYPTPHADAQPGAAVSATLSAPHLPS